MYSSSQSFALLIGRILFGVLFLVPGIRKALTFSGTVAYMAKNGVPFTEPLAVAAIVLEIGCGILLIVGWNTRTAAVLLAIFVAIITPIFHAFWTFEPAQAAGQLNHFLKNWAIFGGLLYIAVVGAGAYSVDLGGRRRTSMFA